MGTFQTVFYSPMSSFFILWSCWFCSVYKKHSHCDGSIFIFDSCRIKIISTQICSYIKVFNLEKIWCANISYLSSCSQLGIIVNSQWYEDKFFVKDNKNRLLGIKPMGLSAPRDDSLDIITL